MMDQQTDAITIEVNAPLDGASVLSLYKAAGWWSEAENPDTAAAIFNRSYCYAGAFASGKLIGMARVISDGISDAYIQDVTVAPDWRGRGIGKRLVQTLAEHLQARKIGWIGLVAEPGTYPFYESLGFRLQDGYILMLLGERP